MKITGIKKLVVSALFVFAISQVNAQDHKLELGLNGGFGISSIFGSTYPYNDFGSLSVNNSWATGLIFQVNFNDVFSLTVNPMYDRKGGKRKDITIRDGQGNLLGVFDQHINLSYITLPILARFSFGGQSAKFVLGVGPYVSRMLNARSKFVEGRNVNGSLASDEVDVSGIYKSFDFGPTLGLGFASQLNDFLILEAEIRTSISFIQIIDNNTNSGPFEYFVDGSRNFSANFLVGLKYILPD